MSNKLRNREDCFGASGALLYEADYIEHLKLDYTKLEAENKELKKRSAHYDGCEWYLAKDCTCGLDKLLKK